MDLSDYLIFAVCPACDLLLVLDRDFGVSVTGHPQSDAYVPDARWEDDERVQTAYDFNDPIRGIVKPGTGTDEDNMIFCERGHDRALLVYKPIPPAKTD